MRFVAAIAIAITLILPLGGCLSVDVDARLVCEDGLETASTAELIFGRNIGDAPGVSDADWTAFLDAEVTPRFPDGLTVIDAAGQWRSLKGAVVHEASKVLMVVLTGAPGEQEKLEAVRSAYKARFRQDSVLLIERSACVGF